MIIVILTFSFIVRVSQGSDLIFSTKLSQNEWMGNLLNPCNAEESAIRVGNLSVDGRTFEMKIVAGNIKARLQGCKNNLLTNECAGLNLHSLSAMEEQSTEISSMEVIFKKAMLISAHFKYMAEDWRIGRECNGASRSNLTKAFERQALYFTNFMCKLMVTPSGVARPSTSLMRSVYRPVMDFEIHHYQDCNGRAQRDCKVIASATSFLEGFLDTLQNP